MTSFATLFSCSSPVQLKNRRTLTRIDGFERKISEGDPKEIQHKRFTAEVNNDAQYNHVLYVHRTPNVPSATRPRVVQVLYLRPPSTHRQFHRFLRRTPSSTVRTSVFSAPIRFSPPILRSPLRLQPRKKEKENTTPHNTTTWKRISASDSFLFLFLLLNFSRGLTVCLRCSAVRYSVMFQVRSRAPSSRVRRCTR